VDLYEYQGKELLGRFGIGAFADRVGRIAALAWMGLRHLPKRPALVAKKPR